MLASIHAWSDRRCAIRAEGFARRWSGAIAVPPYFLELLILIEDKRFPTHHGLDPFSMVRAFRHNLRGAGCRQGASTIAQQLYNVRRNRAGTVPYSRSLVAKLVQLGFAVWITYRLSKLAVLSEYLQSVYWGDVFVELMMQHWDISVNVART